MALAHDRPARYRVLTDGCPDSIARAQEGVKAKKSPTTTLRSETDARAREFGDIARAAFLIDDGPVLALCMVAFAHAYPLKITHAGGVARNLGAPFFT